MTDSFDRPPAIDGDATWVVADATDEDLTTVVFDEGVAEFMAECLDRTDAELGDRLANHGIYLDGEQLDEVGLRRIIVDATATCRRVAPGAQFDRDGSEQIAVAAQLLAQLWALSVETTEPHRVSDTARVSARVDALGKLAADSTTMLLSRFRPRRDGTFSLRWRQIDLEIIDAAISDLKSVMLGDDPAIARLFPSPYGDDLERNQGWDALVRGELIERRLAALETVAGLMDRRSADADELGALMRSLNDARLVIGTRLDVGEDGTTNVDDPADRAALAVYEHLGQLVFEAVRALRTNL